MQNETLPSHDQPQGEAKIIDTTSATSNRKAEKGKQEAIKTEEKKLIKEDNKLLQKLEEKLEAVQSPEVLDFKEKMGGAYDTLLIGMEKIAWAIISPEARGNKYNYNDKLKENSIKQQDILNEAITKYWKINNNSANEKDKISAMAVLPKVYETVKTHRTEWLHQQLQKPWAFEELYTTLFMQTDPSGESQKRAVDALILMDNLVGYMFE